MSDQNVTVPKEESDTPKTDAIAEAIGLEVVPADFARAQERRIEQLTGTMRRMARHVLLPHYFRDIINSALE